MENDVAVLDGRQRAVGQFSLPLSSF